MYIDPIEYIQYIYICPKVPATVPWYTSLKWATTSPPSLQLAAIRGDPRLRVDLGTFLSGSPGKKLRTQCLQRGFTPIIGIIGIMADILVNNG